ncbi:sodium-dependent transporter [Exilibacterium tricleocarpae]|uniref:Sodium-dependent transporter n=1 Tax=Exilibacterium tricleocarpae TaxID=2591008 RepID=A0A545TBD6_9GAMM|nr:sodium-dependent transporter [Exilibacterium tricleocarpae]TQV74529.1 sodium-dependent transporter [Exilibacterium tricleocarpae]
MSAPRGQFSSKLGFILAAAGSAVGLGNIWGFPTQTASNGGAAFVVVYFVLAFLLAYPALMAELIIGRHARANVVTALGSISRNRLTHWIGTGVGYYGVIIASLILSFYTVVAGWMLAHWFDPIADVLGMSAASEWLTTNSVSRNLLAGGLFALVNMWIIARGIENGIERWSTRLMPMLLAILVLLIIYVLTRPGAMEGLTVYLVPDWSRVTEPGLIIDALGQAFFSLSLGVGTMLVYGSYLSKQENLPGIGVIVTLVDTSIAFIAGLLIIPSIYVAKHYGTKIFTETGELIAGPDLIFQVLPTLFESMGAIGLLVAFAFFALMTIAAVTSSISMLEVPVSTAVEQTGMSRPRATYLIGSIIFAISSLLIFNFPALFVFVIDLTTKYSEPLLGVAFCLFAGWVLHRDKLLAELREGSPQVEKGLFWKIWPAYVRVFCPILILITFFHSVSG